ncbi:hypothetical protein ACJZ2D_009565 [Fusarium nematophilum]
MNITFRTERTCSGVVATSAMASSPPVLAQAVLIDSSATVVVLIINTITPLDISIPTRTTSVPDELHDDGHTLEVGLADLHGLGPARDIVVRLVLVLVQARA